MSGKKIFGSEADEEEKIKRWREFNDAVKARRQELGITQTVAAARAGMRNQQWPRYETNTSPLRRGTVLTIAESLGWNKEEALRLAGYITTIENDNDIEAVINQLQVIAFRPDKDGFPSEVAIQMVQQRLKRFLELLDETEKAIQKLRKIAKN